MKSIKILNMHMISDSSGETVSTVGRAAAVQFEGLLLKEHLWPLIRNKNQLTELFKSIEKNPGIIIYTMVKNDILSMIKQKCAELNLPCISLLDYLTEKISDFINLLPTRNIKSKVPALDEQYFSRIDSLNYTINHDDGQNKESIKHADIIIIGVSRTSKTPISLYLGQRGYRTANIPFILHNSISLSDLKSSALLIGLTISVEQLSLIRYKRYYKLVNGRIGPSNYINITHINEELREALIFFKNNNIVVVDVTNKAIEEVVAEIINLFALQKGKNYTTDLML